MERFSSAVSRRVVSKKGWLYIYVWRTGRMEERLLQMRQVLGCRATGARCLEQAGLREGEYEAPAAAPAPAPYDPTRSVTLRVWEQRQQSLTSWEDNGSPLRQQAIARAQRDVSGDPTSWRVYIADNTPFRLLELRADLTLAAPEVVCVILFSRTRCVCALERCVKMRRVLGRN